MDIKSKKKTLELEEVNPRDLSLEKAEKNKNMNP